jgi:hypothetical protein
MDALIYKAVLKKLHRKSAIEHFLRFFGPIPYTLGIDSTGNVLMLYYLPLTLVYYYFLLCFFLIRI